MFRVKHHHSTISIMIINWYKLPVMTSSRWLLSSLLKNVNKMKICYLSVKFHKWDIKMTAVNSLPHVRSIHANMEDSSKHK
jgi:hypothetical protein